VFQIKTEAQPGQAAPLCHICTWLFGSTWQKHLENVIYNAQRGAATTSLAHTYIRYYIRPGNWSTLVGLGRIKSHSTSKLNGIGITCHRSHTALTATDSPVNRARIEIQAAKKRKQEPAGGTSVIEMGTTL